MAKSKYWEDREKQLAEEKKKKETASATSSAPKNTVKKKSKYWEDREKQLAEEKLAQAAGKNGETGTSPSGTQETTVHRSLGELNRSSRKTESGETIPGATVAPENKVVNASVRSSEEVRAELDSLDEEITKARHGSLKSDAGVLFGGGYSEKGTTKNDRYIAQLESTRERLQQEWEAGKKSEYDSLKDREDYAEKSQFRSTKTGEPKYDAFLNSYTDSGYGDALYDYINGDSTAGDILRNRMNTGDPLSVTTDLSFVEEMSDEERANYNYIHETEGAKRAEQYLEYIQSDLYRRQREAEEQQIEDYAEAHPIKASAVSIVGAPLKGLTYAGQVAEAVANGGKLDTNASYNRFTYAPNTLRETVSKQIESKWGKVGSFGYNVAMSMADFLTASGMTGGSSLSMMIMGSGAAADTTLSALERGLDSDKALALGAVSGLAEAFTEKVSIENLFSTEWSEKALKYFIKNTLSEGAEEGASTIINTLADIFISGEKSEWQQSVNAYIYEGYDKKSALWNTFKDKISEIGLDVLSGAISGGIMSGGNIAFQKTGQAAVNREIARQGQETIRQAVQEDQGSREIAEGLLPEDAAYTPTKKELKTEHRMNQKLSAEDRAESGTFEKGSEVLRDRLMTAEEESHAREIENASDETEATAIKYGASQKQLNQARAISNVTGREIVFYKESGGEKKDGFYNRAEDRIYINVNSKKTVPTILGHELTHTLQNTKAYRDLARLTIADIRRSGGDLEQMREDVRKLYAKADVELATADDIDEEIIAKYVEKNLLSNEREIYEVWRRKPSVARKISSAVDKMLIKLTGYEGQADMKYLEDVKALYDRAEEAAERSVQKKIQTQQTGKVNTEPNPEANEPDKADRNTVRESVQGRQTSENAGGGAVDRENENITQKAAQERVEDSESVKAKLSKLQQMYDEGEITDEEYDEAYEVIEEERFTGTDTAESSTPIEGEEGKIPQLIRKITGKKNADGVQYSISDDEDSGMVSKPTVQYSVPEESVYTSLPANAAGRLRSIEQDFGKALVKMFGLDMKYSSPDFRQFVKNNARPFSEAYLKTGSIPEEELDALFRGFYTDDTGLTDGREAETEGWKRKEFDEAVQTFTNSLRDIRRYTEAVTSSNNTPETEQKSIGTEEAEEMFRRYRESKRELDRTMPKLLLRPEDELAVGKLLRGEISEKQLDPEEYNVRDIMEAYRVKKAFEEADADVSLYKKRLKAELYRQVDTYLGNISQWKDKASGIAYQRETMERNLRDIIPDAEEAKSLISAFITPVHTAEAERQRFLTQYRDKIRELNISTKKKGRNQQSEAYAVQLVGEAEDNIRILSKSKGLTEKRDGRTLEEWQGLIDKLWEDNPDLDQQKIYAAVQSFRTIYNDLFQQMNEVRLRNGYAPVAFRSGYFPHFTAETEDTLFAKMVRPFGIGLDMEQIPTTIAGLTSEFKPGITWFGHAQERTGFETTYDAVQGYEKYLQGVSNVIYHTDNLQRLRALATRIRYLSSDSAIKQEIDSVQNNDTLDDAQKEVQIQKIRDEGRYRLSNFVRQLDEYTNLLANKKSRLDRGIEELFGRKSYTVLKRLESRVAANMIAGNVGSALTNYIPLNQGIAEIGGSYMLQAMADTLRGTVVKDGFADTSTFLTNRRGSDALILTWTDRASEALSKPMTLIDNFTSETIVRAAYAKNLKANLSTDEAMAQADAMAASIMADRSKGALPTIFESKNPVLKLFTQFQVEVNNEFSVIFKDIPAGASGKKGKEKAKAVAQLAWVLLKYFVGAWLYNEVYEKIVGRRAALDPIDLINDTVGGITGYQVPNLVDLAWDSISTGELPSEEDFRTEKKGVSDAISGAVAGIAEELPFVGSVLGGGRVPISSAIPDVSNLWKAVSSSEWTGEKKLETAAEELSAPLAYLALPFAGGQIKKALQGVRAILRGGVYGVESGEDGGEYLKYPIYDNAWERFSAIAFGTTSSEEGREWIESGYDSLSLQQTAAYEGMTDAGVDARDAYQFIQEYRAVPDEKGRAALQREVLREADISGEGKYAAYYALMASDTKRTMMDEIAKAETNLGGAVNTIMDIQDIDSKTVVSTTAEICDILANADISDITAQIIYEYEVSDEREDDIQRVRMTGMNFKTYLEAHSEYAKINAGDLSAAEKATEFSRWIENQPIADANGDVLRDIFTYYSMVPAEAKQYNSLTDAGISDEFAYKVTEAISALEPEDGKKTVSSLQKARAVIDSLPDTNARMTALETVLSKSEYKKVATANSFGVEPDVYVSFKELLPEYDANGNGSYSQVEVEAALDGTLGVDKGIIMMYLMTGQSIPTALNLSGTQKAILWQIVTGGKPKNNPYSTEIGEMVEKMLEAE